MSSNVTALDLARKRLEEFLPDAVKVLLDLALTAENEAVQLKAIENILDRAGLGKQQQITVGVDEKERQLVKAETESVLARLVRKQEALPAVTPALDTLFVLEGDEPATTSDQDICEAEVVAEVASA